MRDASGPLSDLVVLDLTRVLAGPYGTRLLADLGARVIKIERLRDGDDMRKNHLQLEPGRTDQSTYFIRINAGKESVAVDLSHPQGRAVVTDLARVADVFVENFAPGVIEKLGLGYAAMAMVKPDLVYCSISGFGQTGPWRERQAFAHIINAASGMMHLDQGDLDAPRASNLQAADVLAGTHAFGAILAALRRRDRTGQGAYLDVSMLEALVAADDVSYAAVLNGGETQGSPRPAMGVYAVATGTSRSRPAERPPCGPASRRCSGGPTSRPTHASPPRISAAATGPPSATSSGSGSPASRPWRRRWTRCGPRASRPRRCSPRRRSRRIPTWPRAARSRRCPTPLAGRCG